jgi:hypothetical protein
MTQAGRGCVTDWAVDSSTLYQYRVQHGCHEHRVCMRIAVHSRNLLCTCPASITLGLFALSQNATHPTAVRLLALSVMTCMTCTLCILNRCGNEQVSLSQAWHFAN